MRSAVQHGPAVETRALHKRYGRTVALESLDLRVERGEVSGLPAGQVVWSAAWILGVLVLGILLFRRREL